VLRDMAGFKPATLSALGELPGVGARKLDQWGSEFLSVIKRYA
jgi:ATP-dependent DNA helicase RecQ